MPTWPRKAPTSPRCRPSSSSACRRSPSPTPRRAPSWVSSAKSASVYSASHTGGQTKIRSRVASHTGGPVSRRRRRVHLPHGWTDDLRSRAASHTGVPAPRRKEARRVSFGALFFGRRNADFPPPTCTSLILSPPARASCGGARRSERSSKAAATDRLIRERTTSPWYSEAFNVQFWSHFSNILSLQAVR